MRIYAFQLAYEAIRDLIQSRDYAPGDRIPSERNLSERVGVHRMTVRKAVDDLVEVGLLERRGTSGTYLPAPVVRRPLSGHLSSNSVSDIVRASGGVGGSKLLFFEEDRADRHVAARLAIPDRSPTFVIKRLRTVNDLPFCIEITTVPAERVPGLAAGDLVGDGSLYELLRDRFGICVGSSGGDIGVSNVSPADGEMLGLKRGETVLSIHIVALDTNGVPIEYVTSLNHPKRVTLTAQFS